MAVQSTITVVQVTLTSGTQSIASPYVLDETHIQVRRKRSGVWATLTNPTDYTVSGVGNESGATVILTGTATQAGDVVSSRRKVSRTQLTRYRFNDRFPAKTHENALDKLTMQVQELGDDVGRALRFEEGETLDGTMTLAARAGKIPEFDANGAVGFFSRQEIIDAVDSGVVGQAEDARDAAIAAKVDAEAAQNAAELARDQAQDAETAAEIAQASSELAQAGAEAARDEALATVGNKSNLDLSNTLAGSVTLGLLDDPVLAAISGTFAAADGQGNITALNQALINPVGNSGKWYFSQVAGTLTGTNAGGAVVENGGYLYSDGTATWKVRGASPTVIADGSVSEEKLGAGAVSAAKLADGLEVSPPNISAMTNNGAAGFFFVNDLGPARAGWLSKLTAYCQTGGTAAIVRLIPNGSLWTIADIYHCTINTGVTIFTPSLLPKWAIRPQDRVGIMYVTAVPKYQASGATGYAYLGVAISAATFSGLTLASTANAAIAYSFEVNCTVAVTDADAATALSYVGREDGSALATGTLIWLWPYDRPTPGFVEGVTLDINSANNGQAQLQLIELTSTGTINVIETSAVSGLVAGRNFLRPVTHFPATWEITHNRRVAVQTVTSGATVRYVSSGGGGYYFYLGTASGSGVTVTYTAGGSIRMGVLTRARSATAGTQTLEHVSTFTGTPSGWSATGGWTYSGGAAISSATGIANQLVSDKTYGLNRRRLRWEFSVAAATDIALFFTKPLETGTINSGTVVRVNGSNGLLEIAGQYTGGGEPAVDFSTALGFALAAGRIYVIEIEKSWRTVTVTVWDKSGNGYATLTRTVSPWGYSTYPSFGYDIGALHGAPGCAAAAGTLSVWSFEHRALCDASPWLYICGDSITEGFGVTDSEVWGKLLTDAIGARAVAVSGIGGAKTDGLMQRWITEVAVLRPRNVLIYIGTNTDANFNAYTAWLVQMAVGYGATVYLCTIPTKVSETNFVNGLPSWVHKVKLDLALTNTGAGSGVLAALYANTDASANAYNDGVHPNALGNLRMAERVRCDSPEIFNV